MDTARRISQPREATDHLWQGGVVCAPASGVPSPPLPDLREQVIERLGDTIGAAQLRLPRG